MMEPISVTLTKAGLAAIVDDNAPVLGPAVIAQLALTNTPFTATSAMTSIPGEFKRIAVHGEVSGDDVLHVVGIDDSADVYEYRGFGIFFADGTLFAAYGQADPIAGKASSSVTYVPIDVQLAQGQTANIAFASANFLNPPATTTRQGVAELATLTEAKAGTDTSRVLTPSAAKGALLTWLQALDPAELLELIKLADGAGSGLDGDTLDGLSSGYFWPAALAGNAGSNENGHWLRHSNGMIEQWGSMTAGETNSPGASTFPRPFSDTASVNLQVTARSPNNAATNGNKVGGNVVSNTQFSVFSDDGDVGVFWRAIGLEG
ncbi:hypothetical protein EOE18_13820 [Novosphingobium umbonatum]|uniref:Putative tail fiber protein gp53-like C-terminal domain-containing protein n=1 Tax=Novosphingobium umbonatum TaxID=1908524 RepID=A0A3S2UQX7_9SPHN|nr:hypothetical protein [Novosphingobium umbonatum]RVU03929.1 hypothetical protein EOE18_13820 [Novosphingobium umbonatum]